MNKRICIIMCAFFLIQLLLSGNAMAQDTSLPDIEWIEEDKLHELFIELGFIFVPKEEIHIPFRDFAVDEDGRYAVLIEDGANLYFNVYDNRSNYLFGYMAPYSGQMYGIQLNDYLEVYLFRSHYVVLLDSNGDCIAIGKYSDTDLRDSNISNQLNRRNIVINDSKYYSSAKKESISQTSRHQSYLIVEENGKRSILYEANESQSNLAGFAQGRGLIIIILGVIVITASIYITQKR